MKSDGNCYFKLVYHCLDHIGNGLKARHIFARALGNTENYRGIALLCSEKDSLCPFKIVNIELPYRVLARYGLFEHFFCCY